MFNQSNDDDYYIGGKNNQFKNNHSTNLSKYGSMHLPLIKPSLQTIRYGNSISSFQQQLQRITNKAQFKAQQKYLERKKRLHTQNYITQQSQWDQKQKITNRSGRSGTKSTNSYIIPNSQYNIHNNKIKESNKQLHAQLQQIKKMVQEQSKINSIQSKFQKLYNQIQKKNTQSMTQMPPPNIMYPPYMYPPPQQPYPYYPPQQDYTKRSKQSRRKPSQDFDSSDDILSRYDKKPSRKPSSNHKSQQSFNNNKNTKPVILNKNRIKSLLKKHFIAVFFIFSIKKQAKKLALARKNNLRKFWLERFQSQVTNMKNWILQTLKYSLSIILQKRELNFNYLNQKRQKVKRQKQKLVLQLCYLSVEQMKKLSTPKDVSLFSQVLVIISRCNNYPISRFWTVNQMQKLRISQYYGFVRADVQQQKWMLGVFVFMKVLVFNMLLQPYKFDSINFTKTSQPLLSNMYLIASILYHVVSEVLDQYLQAQHKQIYEPGNWLNVKKQFICECCQPLIFNSDVVQQGEYISGMIQMRQFGDMLSYEQNVLKWQSIKQKVRQVIDNLYKQMIVKSKMIKSNLKYKMYN